MTKIIGVGAAVLCLFIVSCKNESFQDGTTTRTTATASTGTAAASTATGANQTMTAGSGSAVMKTGSTFTAATDLTVTFKGLVVFALSNGVERAVVPRITGHPMTI